jgi:UDP-N-acetylmuramate: L-alanyl-gamma-D-glutamyl-meso-diaminopimelate ligase
VFQAAYAEAFDAADLVFVREAPHPEKAPPTDRFSSVKLVSDLNDRGVAAFWGMNAQELIDRLLGLVRPGDVVAVLSNGAFEGLHGRLIAELGEGKR